MYAKTLATNVARTTATLAYNDWRALLYKEAQTDEERGRAKEMADLWFRVVAELDWRIKRKGPNQNRLLGRPGRIMVVADALTRTASEIAYRVDYAGEPEPTDVDPFTDLSGDEIDTLIEQFPKV